MRKMLLISLALLMSSPALAQLQFEIPTEDDAGRVTRRLLDGGRFRIYASGDIKSGDTERFRQFVSDNGIDWAIVVFNSPGGSLLEALKLGEAIRELKFDSGIGAQTSGSAPVPSLCASSCAYAFAGGLNRFYDEFSGRLGIHQFYVPGQTEGSISEVQLVSALLIQYLTRMGVDADAFSVATTAESSDMVWLSPASATKLGLANNGTQPTTAEIKTIGMVPYLRLEQVRSAGHSRVLLTCDKRQLAIMAGVVTNPEESAFHSALSQRSYLELDGREVLVASAGGTRAQDSVMWLERDLDNSIVAALLAANQLDIWTEGGGAVRWGARMDLKPVKEYLRRFVADCRGF